MQCSWFVGANFVSMSILRCLRTAVFSTSAAASSSLGGVCRTTYNGRCDAFGEGRVICLLRSTVQVLALKAEKAFGQEVLLATLSGAQIAFLLPTFDAYPPTALWRDQVGTLLYIAPEIVRGDRYDERCDVYSFAVVLLAMLELRDDVIMLFGEEVGRPPCAPPCLCDRLGINETADRDAKRRHWACCAAQHFVLACLRTLTA